MPEVRKTPQLKLLQDTRLHDRVVLIRADDNVVKAGKIEGPLTINTVEPPVKRETQ